MKQHTLWTFAFGLCAFVSAPALAYVGPGAGLSLLGAFWALLLAVGAALVFLVAWPLRRMRRRRREQTMTDRAPDRPAPTEQVSPQP